MVLERAGAVAGLVALVLGIWLSLRSLGFLQKRSYSLTSRYLPPTDSLDFDVMPHFVLQYENDGEVPVVFSDFELLLPRKMFRGDTFIDHLGAELLIDKRPSSTVGAIKQFDKVDYRTNKVRLEPGDSHTDFFDLGAFLPNFDPTEVMQTGSVPSDFHPVLQFRDSFGHEYYCDEDDINAGPYQHPECDKAFARGMKLQPERRITTSRSRWRGKWSQEHADERNDTQEL